VSRISFPPRSVLPDAKRQSLFLRRIEARMRAPIHLIYPSMSKRRRSKTLEKTARAIKDSDEFVEHIFNIARGFEAHHELDSGAGARAVRQSLKAFEKHAGALAEWLESSSQRGTPESEALSSIGDLLQSRGVPASEPTGTRVWLEQATQASRKAEAQLQGKKLKKAPRFAAEALRSTFEHHKLKVSLQATEKKQSDAIKLLCAIAKDGGNAAMTPQEAKQWLSPREIQK
jgi:hypothetical protein